jgi:putative addiction module component (TIGR02574 family)
MTIDQLEQEVLKLSVDQRARLAERIISSLDSDAEIEQEWAAEVRRRDAELESGEVTGISVEDALSAVRNRFGW